MRTNFKYFGELNQGDVEFGDYVIFDFNRFGQNRMDNKIAWVLRVRKHYNEIDVEFDEPIGKMFGLSLSDVKYWSSDREKLEEILTVKKYNL